MPEAAAHNIRSVNSNFPYARPPPFGACRPVIVVARVAFGPAVASQWPESSSFARWQRSLRSRIALRALSAGRMLRSWPDLPPLSAHRPAALYFVRLCSSLRSSACRLSSQGYPKRHPSLRYGLAPSRSLGLAALWSSFVCPPAEPQVEPLKGRRAPSSGRERIGPVLPADGLLACPLTV